MVAGSPKITSNWAKFALLGRLFSCYAIIAADKNDTSPSKINTISFGLRVFFVARFVKRNSFSNHFIGSIRINTHIWTWLSFNCDRAVSIRFDGSFLLLTGSVIGHGIGMGFFRFISDTNIVILDLEYEYEFNVRFGNATEWMLPVISIFSSLPPQLLLWQNAWKQKWAACRVPRVYFLQHFESCLLLRCFFLFVFISLFRYFWSF